MDVPPTIYFLKNAYQGVRIKTSSRLLILSLKEIFPTRPKLVRRRLLVITENIAENYANHDEIMKKDDRHIFSILENMQ